ncbi:MAG: DNA mismatch repair endonuclease MutL [Acidobacteriota bacterium]
MGLIRILPPQIADQIAAGEVVDRPASVLRELIDNALDAGASRIEAELTDGGIGLIRISDNGLGMERDDAVMAFERHATSKIRSGGDLQEIQTLGFRGEALAAIAAVARVELVTAPAVGEGSRVVVDQGRLMSAGPASRSQGTSLSVIDLFAGIPARRKFLKTAATELDHCVRTIQRAALARPEVGFRIRHADRVLLDAPSAHDSKSRIADVLGSKWANGLVPVEADGGSMRLHGFAARSDLHRFDRDGFHIFVNRRPVRDAMLMRAVQDGFRNLLPSGAFPVVALYLELPPSEVDVNVHPAKSEVRFLKAQEVRAMVVAALRRALGSWAAVPSLSTDLRTSPVDPNRIREYSTNPASNGPDNPRIDFLVASSSPTNSDTYAAEGAGAPSRADALTISHLVPANGLVALTQYAQCFIVAQDRDGLLIVDQHVAHERLLFEELCKMADSGPLPRQLMLFPVTLDVPPAIEELAGDHGGVLSRLGFGVEPLGGGTLLIREVPSVVGRSAPAEAVLRVLDRLEREAKAGADALFSHALATVACHTAVRKGMTLGLPQMNYILRGLHACEAPTHCPHGRVVSLRLTPEYLERSFGRT